MRKKKKKGRESKVKVNELYSVVVIQCMDLFKYFRQQDRAVGFKRKNYII